MLVLVFVLVCTFVVPLGMMGTKISLFAMHRQQAQTLVDAASLIAANDLSKITINDPHFGYVSLSNYPAIGKATRAPDGEPLPVVGINTLIGTVRQNALIARELDNENMSLLAEQDRLALDDTIKQLNEALSYALGEPSKCKKTPKDINGQVVDPVSDVTNFLSANLPANMELESVQLSAGWLTNGGPTTIPCPPPKLSAPVHKNDKTERPMYRAFSDLPVGKLSFCFAGIGPRSSLVNPSEFCNADEEHICSIVRVECTFVLKDSSLPGKVTSVACSQPFTLPDATTNGVMTLRFLGGPPAGLQSWRDLLRKNTFQDHQLVSYDAVGGDFPLHASAKLRLSYPQLASSTAQQFAEHLYFWLRSGHLRPRADAILAMLNEPFQTGDNQVYVYQFEANGEISRRIVPANIFPAGVVADNQFSSVADTSTSFVNPVIIFRDNVMNLSTTEGGLHCGQPLAGFPLSQQELLYCRFDELAPRFSQRATYSRGLALDIEVSDTNTREVTSMRSLPAGRKI
jgi:hypothetical protein